ncbi:MAG: serine/threonine protein kinase, partial [Chloroflexi bacterium]|nr:serine/threonine protein kinase [Chloroflexota bacterium]
MEKVGPYKILAEVGKGSTARVYRAWDEAQALEVAVKLMSARISHQELYAERVSEQVTAVNQLQHPHILPVLETGMHDGRLYLVIPFMKGGTLRSRLDDGSLPQAELWQMMRQVASALDSSQAAGISHLDIKPTNILFNRKGNAFVADYGLMQAIDVTLHASGLPGTLAYMSPELFVGGGTDGRADQYSLAIVAFESLSGQLPFSGNVTQLMFKQVHESPPLELLHDDELAQVLGQALAKKPDERFNTTSEFVMALTAAVLSVAADANMTFIMGATRAVTDPEPEPAAASVELIITPEEDEPEEASDATLIAPSPLRPLPLTTDIESEEELHLDEALDDVLIAYDSDATMIVAPPTAPKFPEESERPPVA